MCGQRAVNRSQIICKEQKKVKNRSRFNDSKSYHNFLGRSKTEKYVEVKMGKHKYTWLCDPGGKYYHSTNVISKDQLTAHRLFEKVKIETKNWFNWMQSFAHQARTTFRIHYHQLPKMKQCRNSRVTLKWKRIRRGKTRERKYTWLFNPGVSRAPSHVNVKIRLVTNVHEQKLHRLFIYKKEKE